VRRVLAIVLLVIAAGVVALAIWAAIAFGREYGFNWGSLGTIALGVLIALVPAVPGVVLLRRSRR
jgi:hypothetical protein